MDFTSTITFLLIAINVVTSLVTLYGAPQFLERGYLKPYRVIREHTWYELITSGFLHANLAHLFLNMFTLFFFGSVMERILGPGYFLGLYFSGLIVAGIPSVIKFRDDPNYATLGASGAVSAVLFAFVFVNPLQSILVFFIPMPAFVFAFLYLGYTMYESKQARGKINHEAHLAGAIWGIIYLIIFFPTSIHRFLGFFGLSG